MKAYYYYIINLLLFGSLSCGQAYSQHLYSLDECRQKALTNNVKMRNAHNDLKASLHQLREDRTKYFPTVSASGTGFLADKGLLEATIDNNLISVMDDGLFGGVSASLPLFAGGQIVYTNKLARLEVEVNSIRLNQTEKEVLLTTENYYCRNILKNNLFLRERGREK